MEGTGIAEGIMSRVLVRGTEIGWSFTGIFSSGGGVGSDSFAPTEDFLEGADGDSVIPHDLEPLLELGE